MYGPEIKRGSDAWPETDVRPVWLDTDEGLSLRGSFSKSWYDNARIGKCGDIMWGQADALRLPEDHWANRAIAVGFVPWAGGDSAPADWDGGEVLLRDDSLGGGYRWQHFSGTGDIIGYHRKSTKQTVTIEMRTEAEWLDWTAARGAQRHSRGSIRFMELVRDLGLVTPPTPLERFMAEHPDADRRTAELVMGWKG